MTVKTTSRMPGRKNVLAGLAALALLMSGCAGAVGDESSVDSSQGVAPGASDADYREALSEMPETTLVYQPEAPSPEAIAAARALNFKERVEEASGGKITIDIVWGQAIAGFSEVTDALVDGRIDIATVLPIYSPAEFPVSDALMVASTQGGSSPRSGELATNAAILDVAWNSDELLTELESKGLSPLIPFYGDGSVMAMCTDPVSEESSWQGRQIGVQSAVQADQTRALGANPVSIEYPELYEALQRNTIDCTMAHGALATGAGFLDVTPHFAYSTEVGISRGAQAVVAGSNYESLPLAAKQLIFDEMVTLFEAQLLTSLEGNANLATAITENNGTSRILNETEVSDLKALSTELLDEKVSSGVVADTFPEDVQQKMNKWEGIVEELNLGDDGDLADFNTWHDPEDANIRSFAERVYVEVMLEHRPE